MLRIEVNYVLTKSLDLKELAANPEAESDFAKIISNPSQCFENLPLLTVQSERLAVNPLAFRTTVKEDLEGISAEIVDYRLGERKHGPLHSIPTLLNDRSSETLKDLSTSPFDFVCADAVKNFSYNGPSCTSSRASIFRYCSKR